MQKTQKEGFFALSLFTFLLTDSQKRPASTAVVTAKMVAASSVAHSKDFGLMTALSYKHAKPCIYEVIACSAELDAARIRPHASAESHCRNFNWTVNSDCLSHILTP
jgi:hypothetical protein